MTGKSVARYARVALDIPGGEGFDYSFDEALRAVLEPGAWVLVPWGRGRRIGLIAELVHDTPVALERIRPLIGPVEGAPRLPASWLTLVRFAASYYHRSFGEVALPAVPKLLRAVPGARARGSPFERARQRGPSAVSAPDGGSAAAEPDRAPELTDPQHAALQALQHADGFRVFLLHGVTGSGKTEVYLNWIARLLLRAPDAQALLLVPEIALTPQLLSQVAARFPSHPVAVLHSELPDGERASHWLAAAEGRARLVIGTRLAVFTPLPGLAGVVVDEEHDPSYKQQEGVRYSARDLAVALAAQCRVPVVLGSATPSLETWRACEQGRYTRLSLPGRVTGGALPRLQRVDPRGRRLQHSLVPEAVAAIGACLARGEQALVFINRRGYAPVLSCAACGWLSRCDACSSYRVLHRMAAPGVPDAAGGDPRALAGASERGAAERRSGPPRYLLVCHHCSAEQVVPRTCPDCGNVDLTPLGRGTQRLEEGLRELFPAARVGRVDRDVARRRGAAREVIDAAHAGTLDLLVGTQMLAKGHDFRRLSLVVVVDPDSGLYSSDFRAPERLFSVLMQVSGRAGRAGGDSTVIVQTRFPAHPLFDALGRQDFAGFAAAQLAEREVAELPPFVHQALVRAEARELEQALAFLRQAREAAVAIDAPGVRIFDPVQMPLVRLAGRERAQLLVESDARPALHRFLDTWLAALARLRTPARWQLDVDPQEI